MRDPSVEARAGGYSNARLDHYINDGPTASKNKNTGKKPKDLYAKIDMSKKSKKKNVIYILLFTVRSNTRVRMEPGEPRYPWIWRFFVQGLGLLEKPRFFCIHENLEKSLKFSTVLAVWLVSAHTFLVFEADIYSCSCQEILGCVWYTK